MKNKHNISNTNEMKPFSFEKIGNKNHFITPNDYFEYLPQLIINKKLNNKYLIKQKISYIYRVFAPSFGALLIIALVFFLKDNSTKTAYTNEELSTIIIEDRYIEFDEDLVYEVYSEMDYSSPPLSNENEEIIDYLINENVNINLILEEL